MVSDEIRNDSRQIIQKLIDEATEYARHFGAPRDDHRNLRAFFLLAEAVDEAKEFLERNKP